MLQGESAEMSQGEPDRREYLLCEANVFIGTDVKQPWSQ